MSTEGSQDSITRKERDAFAVQKIKDEFDPIHTTLMPLVFWNDKLTETWNKGTKGWLDVMLSEKARPLGAQIDFYNEQVEVTRGMFSLAMHVQTEGILIERNDELEKTVFLGSWESFFAEADELFVDVRQLGEVFSELIVRPAAMLGNYQLAMGRTKQSSEAMK